MEKELPGPMTPFDELVTTPELQLVKLLIPYVPGAGRQTLAFYVKFTELRSAIHMFRTVSGNIQAQSEDISRPVSFFEMLSSFRPYLDPRGSGMIDQIIQMRDIMEMAEAMANSASAGSSGEMDMTDILSSILPADQQEAFQTYSKLFSEPLSDIQKGDDPDKRMDEQSGDHESRSDET